MSRTFPSTLAGGPGKIQRYDFDIQSHVGFIFNVIIVSDSLNFSYLSADSQSWPLPQVMSSHLPKRMFLHLTTPEENINDCSMQWHYSQNDQQQGPIEESQLREMLADGTLPGTALVWREGMTDWIPALDMPKQAPPPIPSAAESANAYREGSCMVVRSVGGVPDRCVVCNGPAVKKIRKKLFWHHPALYILIPMGLIIYLIVAMAVRKMVIVNLGLCEKHQKRAVLDKLFTLAAVIGGFLMIFGGAIYHAPPMIVAGILAIFLGLFYIAIRNIVSVKSIDGAGIARVKGAGKKFLDSLPVWNSRV